MRTKQGSQGKGGDLRSKYDPTLTWDSEIKWETGGWPQGGQPP